MNGGVNPDSKKAVRRRKEARERQPEHHAAGLGDEIEAVSLATSKSRAARKRSRQIDDDELLTSGLSNKILLEARKQRDEIDDEERQGGDRPEARPQLGRRVLAAVQAADDSDEDEPASDDEAAYDLEVEVAEEDERALAAFMTSAPGGTRTLADLIVERLRSTGTAADGGDGDDDAPVPADMDPRVVEVYRGVGALLARYKSGKVPKAFKIIPALANWEEVLYLTAPEAWTPHATFQATRLFASNLNAKMAQRFFNLVLLPRVRADILANRRLHFTLFCALKKATYKPAAFFKGLLLPLCQAGNCNLREAVIMSAVISRASIPMLHSAAALLKLAEMDYSGTNSFFIRVLIDKKYALPYRVVDALVSHFLRFQAEERTLPVVWHQCLLAFVQRYKFEIAAPDKERLQSLLRAQRHYLVTPEVVRELGSGHSRGETAPPDVITGSGKGISASGGAKRLAVGAAVNGRPGEDVRALPPVAMMEDDAY